MTKAGHSRPPGRSLEADQRGTPLGGQAVPPGADLQPCPHHSPFPALGAGVPGPLPSAPWDPWLHGALTVPGDSGLCNKAGCQVIHQEVSVSLEWSPTHTPPRCPLEKAILPGCMCRISQPRGLWHKAESRAELGQLSQPESSPGCHPDPRFLTGVTVPSDSTDKA